MRTDKLEPSLALPHGEGIENRRLRGIENRWPKGKAIENRCLRGIENRWPKGKAKSTPNGSSTRQLVYLSTKK